MMGNLAIVMANCPSCKSKASVHSMVPQLTKLSVDSVSIFLEGFKTCLHSDIIFFLGTYFPNHGASIGTLPFMDLYSIFSTLSIPMVSHAIGELDTFL